MSRMTPKFAIKVLCAARVAPIRSIPGNPVRYGGQNQKFYDMARNMAVAAIKENAALRKQNNMLTAQVAKLSQQGGAGGDEAQA